MEYKALSQNTYVFTKTTTINGAMDLSNPYSPRLGQIKIYKGANTTGVTPTDLVYGVFSPNNTYISCDKFNITIGVGSVFYPRMGSCVVDGVTYCGYKNSYYMIQSPDINTKWLVKAGKIKVVIYVAAEGTIDVREYSFNDTYITNTYTDSSYSPYVNIPKAANDLILSITYEEAAEQQ